jgi:hypothetical protein
MVGLLTFDSTRLERETNAGTNQAEIVFRLVDDFVAPVRKYSDVTGEPVLKTAAPVTFQKNIVPIAVPKLSAHTIADGIEEI